MGKSKKGERQMRRKKFILSISIGLVLAIVLGISTYSLSMTLLLPKSKLVTLRGYPQRPFFDFEEGWYVYEWGPYGKAVKSESKGDITLDYLGVSFKGNNKYRIGIMKNVSIPVSHCKKLTVYAAWGILKEKDFAAPNLVAPLAIIVGYTDEKGVAHHKFSLHPFGPDSVFWLGFTSLGKEGLPTGTEIVNRFRTYVGTYDKGEIPNIDLMQLKPKPVRIDFVAVESAGPTPRESQIIELNLYCY